MELANIAQRYLAPFKEHHGTSATAEQWSALNAIIGCRTAQYGELSVSCTHCNSQDTRYQSCGHRSCNRCQNHTTTQWLQRQTHKLLPIEYFMVTFTLPRELRALATANQARVRAAVPVRRVNTENLRRQ